MRNQLKIVLALIFCLAVVISGKDIAIAQPSDSSAIRVDSIALTGNTKTDPYIILNELTFGVGDIIDSTALRFNEERIYSLGIFTLVKLYHLRQPISIVKIVVEEAWYIWPIPHLDFRDRDWSKISYGIDLLIKNFRGMNETLRLKTFFGYDPGVQIGYFIPYLSRSANISGNFNFSWGRIKNKSLIATNLYGDDFSTKYYSLLISTSKRFNLYQYVTLSGYYEKYDFPDFSLSMNADLFSDAGLLCFAAGYQYDTRDLAQFPSQGSFLNSSLTYKFESNATREYLISAFDLRKYVKLSDNINAKFRMFSRFVSGKNIVFNDYSFLGYGEKIRGFFNRVQEGESSIFLSTELLYPLMKDYNLRFDYPVIPEQLQSFRVSIYNHFFIDGGSVSAKGYTIAPNDFDIGIGTGLTILILPYRIFRIEYARNLIGKDEFIIELDLSF